MDLDALLAEEMRRRRRPGFELGWTAWVDHRTLPVSSDRKMNRPWCRGHSKTPGVTIWFPRTSRHPGHTEKWAVRSPAGQLRGLDVEGWFFANGYVTKPSDFAPFIPPAVPCGILPETLVEQLHERLKRFYDDTGHR